MTPADYLRMLDREAKPAPWRLYDRGIGWEVHEASRGNINDEHRECFREADAALIVAMRSLVGPLARVIESFEKRQRLGDTHPAYEAADSELWEAQRDLRAAIAKLAEGK